MSTLKLTARGRYAVAAMISLAREDRPVPLQRIADTGNISLSYLEQLFSALRRHGHIKSHRGPGGGYMLARPSAEILISDILISAEDSLPARRKVVHKNDPDEDCDLDHKETSALWAHVGEIVHERLRQLSLEDVASGRLIAHRQKRP